MFHFSKKYKNTNLEWLEVDMHSHLLPGIDDGAKTMEDSITYIKALHELGFKKLIITPHIFKELYPNSKETILPALEKLKAELKKQGLEIQIEAAAEYMLNNDFDPLLKSEELLCLPGKKILVEMSYLAETPNIEQYIFDLKIKGYQPVLAHPERYVFYHSDFGRYKRVKEMGCMMQLNILSATGYYGKEVKQVAFKLLKEGCIDLVGTDLHHERHLNALDHFVKTGEAYKILEKASIKNKEFLGSNG